MNFRIAIILLLSCGIQIVNGGQVVISKSFQGNTFKDADGWTAVGAQSLTTECSGTSLFGGYGVFGSKATISKVFNLPPHSLINIQVQFWKIDSWDNEEAYLFVDDQLVWSRKFQYNEGDGQKCGQGNDWKELTLNLNLNVKHTGSSAVVVFTSNLDEGASNESWAIRDFVLSIERCPDGCSACQVDDRPENCQFWQSYSNSWVTLDDKKINSDGWEVTGGQAASTNCGGVALFGGYEKIGAKAIVRKIFKINPHYKLKIKVLIGKIDSWDNEAVQIKVDGVQILERRFQYEEGYFGKICGNPALQNWRSLFARLEFDVEHVGNQAQIEFTTTLDEATNNESLGLRDFYIFYASCSANCAECTGPKESQCKKCLKDWILIDGKCQALPNLFIVEQSFLEDQFTDLNGWIVYPREYKELKISECAGKSLIGGFNILGAGSNATKTFNIPPHNRLKLQSTLYKIDSWDGEFMIIQVDGVEIWRTNWNQQTGGSNLCGQDIWLDNITPVEQIFSHNAPKAKVFFTNTLDEDSYNESWGFRDFKLWYEPQESCAVLYSECFFKGKKTEICSKSPNFLRDKIPLQSKSIRIPPQGRLTLFERTDYDGMKITYTEDQTCLDGFDFSLIHLSGQTEAGWIELEQ